MKLAILGPLKRVRGIQNVEIGVPFTARHHSLVEVSAERVSEESLLHYSLSSSNMIHVKNPRQ